MVEAEAEWESLLECLVAAAEHCSAQRSRAGRKEERLAERSFWSSLGGSVQAALDLLLPVLPPGRYTPPMARLLARTSGAVQGRALHLLRSQLSREFSAKHSRRAAAAALSHAALAEIADALRVVCDATADGGTTAAGHGGGADEAAAQKNRQAALLTLELLAREHAAAAPDVFERATVAVVRAACSAAPAVRSAGLLATSSFV